MTEGRSRDRRPAAVQQTEPGTTRAILGPEQGEKTEKREEKEERVVRMQRGVGERQKRCRKSEELLKIWLVCSPDGLQPQAETVGDSQAGRARRGWGSTVLVCDYDVFEGAVGAGFKLYSSDM